MLEWTVLVKFLSWFMDTVFVPIVGFVVWMIKRRAERMDQKIDKIFEQVHMTNGQVIQLQEWKRNHQESTKSTHDSIRGWISTVETRLNDFIDHHRRGGRG